MSTPSLPDPYSLRTFIERGSSQPLASPPAEYIPEGYDVIIARINTGSDENPLGIDVWYLIGTEDNGREYVAGRIEVEKPFSFSYFVGDAFANGGQEVHLSAFGSFAERLTELARASEVARHAAAVEYAKSDFEFPHVRVSLAVSDSPRFFPGLYARVFIVSDNPDVSPSTFTLGYEGYDDLTFSAQDIDEAIETAKRLMDIDPATYVQQ